MNPQDLSILLRSIASYIEGEDNPSIRVISSGLNRALREIQAGKITKLVDKDYSTAMHGLEALIDRLTRAARSLNPQNEAKSTLEHSVADLQGLKAGLSEAFSNLAQVDL